MMVFLGLPNFFPESVKIWSCSFAGSKGKFLDDRYRTLIIDKKSGSCLITSGFFLFETEYFCYETGLNRLTVFLSVIGKNYGFLKKRDGI